MKEKPTLEGKNVKRIANYYLTHTKNSKGITLVSLVVTIIVLIILAGISINAILGEDGIITIAKQAKENMSLAQIDEQTNLNELYVQIETETGTSGGISADTIAKLAQLEERIAELKQTVDNLTGQLENERENSSQLQSTINSLNEQISTLEQQVADSTTERVLIGSGTTQSARTFNIAAIDSNYASYTIENFGMLAYFSHAGTTQSTAQTTAGSNMTYNASTGILTVPKGLYVPDHSGSSKSHDYYMQYTVYLFKSKS